MGRPRKNPDQVETLIAVESGWWTAPDGTEYAFRAGETMVASDHPLVTKGNPAWFKRIDPLRQRPVVEEMTAGPGELRGEESEVRAV